MAVLHEAEHMDLDVAGDFIAMAAQLVYIDVYKRQAVSLSSEKDRKSAGGSCKK